MNDTRARLERRLQREGGMPVAFPSFPEAVRRLESGKLRIYFGIDATSPHLHIGHSVPLLLLEDLATLGHEVIVLLGDFTSRIGDPTDKAAVRTALTPEQVGENIRTYIQQIQKIIPKGSFTVRHNSEWLASMTLEQVIGLSSHVTVQQMLARDMFQNRMKEHRPIFVSEFMYPLMQGYDSVVLDVDGEVGGNDQTFNMLVGRDLIRAYRKKEKLVLPTRLLVDAQTGRKISKTEGGLIALDDSPSAIFEKVSRSIPNDMVRTVFELCTRLPLEAIDARYREARTTGDWRAYNLDLAEELVRMYHGRQPAALARAGHERSVLGEATDEEAVPLAGTPQTPLARLLADALKISKSEAKRLIEQHAVTRNGQPVTDALGPSGAQSGDVLRVGSHRPFRIILKES